MRAALLDLLFHVVVAAALGVGVGTLASLTIRRAVNGKYRRAGSASNSRATYGASGGSGGPGQGGPQGGPGGPFITIQVSGGGAGGVARRYLGPPHPETVLKTEDIVAGEIIAWRMWRVVPEVSLQGDKLKSLVADYFWSDESPAACGTGEFSLASGYGVHSYKSLDYMRTDLPWLHSLLGGGVLISSDDGEPVHLAVAWAYGEVALWGDVIEHERGYRSQYARVRSVCVPTDAHLEAELQQRYKAGAPSEVWPEEIWDDYGN